MEELDLTGRVNALLRLYFLLERGMSALLGWACSQSQLDSDLASALNDYARKGRERGITLIDQSENQHPLLMMAHLLDYCDKRKPAKLLGSTDLARADTLGTLRELKDCRNKLMHGEIRDHQAHSVPVVLKEISALFERLRAALKDHATDATAPGAAIWQRIVWLTPDELAAVATRGDLALAGREAFAVQPENGEPIEFVAHQWRHGLPPAARQGPCVWISTRPVVAAEVLAAPLPGLLSFDRYARYIGGKADVMVSPFGPSDWAAEPFGLPLWSAAPPDQGFLCAWRR